MSLLGVIPEHREESEAAALVERRSRTRAQYIDAPHSRPHKRGAGERSNRRKGNPPPGVRANPGSRTYSGNLLRLVRGRGEIPIEAERYRHDVNVQPVRLPGAARGCPKSKGEGRLPPKPALPESGYAWCGGAQAAYCRRVRLFSAARPGRSRPAGWQG
jgi:hypothetical protein